VPTPATPPPARSGNAAPDPALVIAKGNPSAEQTAAVVAVLAAAAARAAGAASARPAVRSEWAARSRLLREPLPRGPGGWRSSARPR
jgi:hypothetical protein